jgi:nucleoside-diphosphate-sugar epimerase
MDVVIAGGHGKIALHLERLLADSGHRVTALIRQRDHDSDVREAGAEPVMCDLEEETDLSHYVTGADAVVFAAGAGPGSGPERKRTVDLGGALKLIDAARRAGVRRYVIVSSIGADDPNGGSEQMRPYLEAKAEADRRVADSGLDWTIVRPGRLTDDAGTGLVAVTTDMSARGSVPREDVARVLAAVLGDPATIGKTFVVIGGETPVDESVAAVAAA